LRDCSRLRLSALGSGRSNPELNGQTDSRKLETGNWKLETGNCGN
jgi:hypothetical protein